MNDDDFHRRLGALVRMKRLQRGLTQLQLARELGLTRSSVSNIEAGAQPLSLTGFVRLAELLAFDPGQVLNAACEESQSNAAFAAVPDKYAPWLQTLTGRAAASTGQPQ